MSKAARKPTLQSQLKEAYRVAILDAAEDVFTERGFHEAKMSEVAERAGVATGTVYNYFKSKDHVFEAIASRSKAMFAQQMEPVRSIEQPIERLEAFVKKVFEFVEERGALFAVHLERESSRLVMLSRPAHEEPAREQILDVLGEAIAAGQAQGLIREDVPQLMLVHSLSAFMEGAMAIWVSGGRKEALAPCAEFVVKLFIEGASK
ncbi:MAG: TetR/AcrR family transcriptional regulator [Polyangiaceae bacterium]|mgnify:CR=1 FL=1